MPQIGSLFVSLSMNTGQFTQQSQVAAKSLETIEVNSRKLNFALTNLGFQINDVVSGLAQGQAPMRIFAQQTGQIVQLFTQGGGFGKVMGGVATAIRSWITPTTAAVAGFAALGAGFAVLLNRAQQNSEQLRQYNLLLETTGRLQSNLDIGGENNRLRSLGVSRDLANTQRLAIGRNLQLNPGFGERLQTLGANIGAFSGLGPESGFNQLLSAIQGGPEATIRFAASMNALSTAQASALIESARLTGGLKEQNTAIVALETKLKDFAKNAMDPMTQAATTLGTAWDSMLDKMSKTDAVQTARQALIDLFKGIGGVISGETPTMIQQGLKDLGVTGPGTAMTGGTPRLVFGGGFGVGGNRLPAPAGEVAPTAAAGGSSSEYQRLLQLERIGAIPEGSAAAVAGSGALGGVGAAAAAGFGTGALSGKSPSVSAGLGTSGALSGDFFVTRDPQKAIDVADAIAKQKRENAAAIPIQRLWNVEQEAAAAAQAKRLEMQEKGATPAEQEIAATEAATATRAKYNIELGKEITLTGMRIEGDRKIARAMLESEGAAVRVAAAEAAKIETLRRGGSQAQRTQQALEAQSAKTEMTLAQATADDRRETESAQLRVSLLGQSTQYIETQIALLRVRQQVEAAGVPVAQEVVAARVAGVNALQGELEKLRQQQILVGQIKEVAGVFENAFSAAFDSIAEGTFNIRKLMNSLLRDLGKTLASQAFKRLLGADESGGGILGSIAGKLFGFSGGSKATGSGPFGDNWSASELGMTGFATGGSFRVGGYGSIDSQLVAFRASPGEMVDVSPGGAARGGGAEIIRIDLNPSEGWVAGVADQRIVTRSGQIVDVAVRQSQRTVQRNFAGMSAEAQARQM